jgi:glycosyltransferase involved in cell wall biosynthesis
MSEFSRDKHHEFGFSHDMEVVNYFLPKPAGSNIHKDSPHNRPYFLFVGRLERIKGLDEVIPIFKRYTNADLLIVGDGEHGRILRQRAEENENIKFVGRVESSELQHYYHHAIALIVPSVCFETFGIIIIEAFRHSTPVLARRLGPFPEIIRRSGGGMLFSDAAELEAAMHSIQSDPTLRSKLAAAGYAGFIKHWSEDAVIPRYLNVVRKTAHRQGRYDIVEALDSC